DCCPKLNAKFVNRLFHRCWQVAPPVDSVTHCFLGGCYHLIDGDIAVDLRHSLSFLSLGLPPRPDVCYSAAALCAHTKTRRRLPIRAVSREATIDQLFKRMRSSSSALTQQAVSSPRRSVRSEMRRPRPPRGRGTGTADEWPPEARESPPTPAKD